MTVPPEDCAAMDGYALRAGDTAGAGPDSPVSLPVLAGELTAGRAQVPPLPPGRALRIMTGAPLPAGADALVPSDTAREEAGGLLLGAPVAPGSHLRRRSQGLRPGAVCFPAGQRLTAFEVGLLASAGCASVAVRAGLAEPVRTEAGVTHLTRGRLLPEGEGWCFRPARTGASGAAVFEGSGREVAAGTVVRVELLPPRPAPGAG